MARPDHARLPLTRHGVVRHHEGHAVQHISVRGVAHVREAPPASRRVMGRADAQQLSVSSATHRHDRRPQAARHCPRPIVHHSDET
eukprot:9429286-Alexandrium_andersonii.AAC.1